MQDTFDQLGFGPDALGDRIPDFKRKNESHATNDDMIVDAVMETPGDISLLATPMLGSSAEQQQVVVQPWKCWHEGHVLGRRRVISGHAAAARGSEAGRGVISSTCW